MENVAPDPGHAAGGRSIRAPTCRDHGHGRHGTVSLSCATGLFDDTAHHSVRRWHANADHVDFLGRFDGPHPEGHVISRAILAGVATGSTRPRCFMGGRLQKRWLKSCMLEECPC